MHAMAFAPSSWRERQRRDQAPKSPMDRGSCAILEVQMEIDGDHLVAQRDRSNVGLLASAVGAWGLENCGLEGYRCY